MGIHDATGKEKTVIFLNAAIRLAQLIVAAATLGVYGLQKGYWLDHGLSAKINLELAVGTLALITALVFGILPFIFSYRPVALGAPWDVVLMGLYGIAFGLMKTLFLRSYTGDDDDDQRWVVANPDVEELFDHWNTMVRTAYINLAGLVLFLISAVMGLTLLFIGRRSSGRGKASFP